MQTTPPQTRLIKLTVIQKDNTGPTLSTTGQRRLRITLILKVRINADTRVLAPVRVTRVHVIGPLMLLMGMLRSLTLLRLLAPTIIAQIGRNHLVTISSSTSSRNIIVSTTTLTNRRSSLALLQILAGMTMIQMRVIAAHMAHDMSSTPAAAVAAALACTGMRMRLTLMIAARMQRMGMRHVMMPVRIMTGMRVIVLRTALAPIVTVVGVAVGMGRMAGRSRAGLTRLRSQSWFAHSRHLDADTGAGLHAHAW